MRVSLSVCLVWKEGGGGFASVDKYFTTKHAVDSQTRRDRENNTKKDKRAEGVVSLLEREIGV